MGVDAGNCVDVTVHGQVFRVTVPSGVEPGTLLRIAVPAAPVATPPSRSKRILEAADGDESSPRKKAK